MNDDIRRDLLHLTTLRKRVLEAHDVIGQLFANRGNDSSTPPSWEELGRAEKDVEQQVPEFYVWFEPRHARYALVPKSDQENGRKKDGSSPQGG